MARSMPVPGIPKPSCSYHCMIGMALMASPTGKLPVNEIYKYILNNFLYFRTAADNWKNSVRHCLSLGQCFNKVTHPGSFHFKKGFHWQLIPDKQGMVYQEIFRYLATTREKAETYGISSSLLAAGLKMSSLPPNKFSSPGPIANSLVTPMQVVNTPNWSTSMDLQLNQSDLETLRMLGESDTCNLSLSPVDYNLLLNPSMQQELRNIAALLGFPNTLTPQQPLKQASSSSLIDTLSCVTPQKQIIVPTVSKPPSATTFCSITNSPPPSTQQQSYISTVISHYTTSPAAVVPSSTPCTTTHPRCVSITPFASHKIDDFNTGIECCSTSPPIFITRYPSTIELELEDVVTEDEEDIYPFLTDNHEEDDISLTQLNCEGYEEDLEDPLMYLSGRKTSSHHSFSIDPVEGDWNCWGEPAYLDRINTLISPRSIRSEVVLKDSKQSSSESSMKPITSQIKKSNGRKKKQTQTKKVSRKVRKQPLKVSIPFLKLLTSRQAKKYCRT